MLLKLLLLSLFLLFLVYFYLIFLLLCLERGAFLVGFYSFYKIIKDIIRSILGNKAWRYTLIIALIVLFVVLFTDKANAVESQDYVVDYYTTYSFSPDPSSTWYYNMTIIPVFANSSYSISWPSGYNVSFSFVDHITRENSSVLYPYSSYENGNDQGSYGYFAVKDGYLIAQYRQQNSPYQPFTFTITTDYHFTANLQTIHEDLLSLIGVEGEGISKDFSTSSGLIAAADGTFISNPYYTTIYFKCEPQTNYSIKFSASSGSYASNIRYGYCSIIPTEGSSWSTRTVWDGIENPITFTSSTNNYFYFCYLGTYISNVSLTSNNNLIDNITNQAQETRETLTDSNISQNSSDYALPSDSTNDITQDGFSSIFDRIRATFTSGSAAPITITIPFTGRSFTISKQSVFGSANLGIVGTIIQSFWWFVVSLFIVKDIFKKIESIKSGNIEFAETTNIKEDIL